MSKGTGSQGGRRALGVSCWLDEAEATLLQLALDRAQPRRRQDFIREAVLNKALEIVSDEVEVTYDLDGRMTWVPKNEGTAP